MAKAIYKGSVPPDDPMFRGGPQIFSPIRNRSPAPSLTDARRQSKPDQLATEVDAASPVSEARVGKARRPTK